MSFYQNVFDQEFQGYMLLGDRKLIPTFKVAPNKNTQYRQLTWNEGPYDLSSGSNLTFNFSWDTDFAHWATLTIDVAGVVVAATTPSEIAALLNAETTFATMLIASVEGSKVFLTRRETARKSFKFYFGNTGAESIIGFNLKSGVSEFPSYFDRHAIENRLVYPDSLGMLIKLDEGDSDDQLVITAAGFSLTPKEDYELLAGRSGIFTFKNQTVDISDRITEVIEYPAGAKVGDLAKKTVYVYSGANKNPIEVTEIPYTLQGADLITP